MTASPMSMKTSVQQKARKIAEDVPDLDSKLPLWARRSNPIIRRQLGPYWRQFPPELLPVLLWIGFYGLVLVGTLAFPILYLPVMVVLLVTAVAFPAMLYYYGRTLLDVINDSTNAMTQELENGSLPILRASPFSSREIVLSKIMAAVWRRMDDLTIAVMFAVTMGMTINVILYVNVFPTEDYPLLSQGFSFVVLLSNAIRLPLELFMVASIGVMMGVAVRFRNTAFMGTIVIVFFYFLLINLPRLIPMAWPLMLFVEAILPVLLPLGISIAAVIASERMIEES